MIEEEKKDSTRTNDNFDMMQQIKLFATSIKFGKHLEDLYKKSNLNDDEQAMMNKYKDYLKTKYFEEDDLSIEKMPSLSKHLMFYSGKSNNLSPEVKDSIDLKI